MGVNKVLGGRALSKNSLHLTHSHLTKDARRSLAPLSLHGEDSHEYTLIRHRLLYAVDNAISHIEVRPVPYLGVEYQQYRVRFSKGHAFLSVREFPVISMSFRAFLRRSVSCG